MFIIFEFFTNSNPSGCFGVTNAHEVSIILSFNLSPFIALLSAFFILLVLLHEILSFVMTAEIVP